MKTNLGMLVVGTFLMASAVARAQQLPQLPQFQANTPAKAADVNANFETLRGAANAGEGRVTTLEGVNAGPRLTTLEGANAASRIAVLEAQNAALAAQFAASVACPANTPTRFTDKGDGTVCDSQTGLMWEIKTGTVGQAVLCRLLTDCPDPHNVNNRYSWTVPAGVSEPDGGLYTNFLARLNDMVDPNDGTTTSCFAGHCDWRVPTIGELRSILQAPFPDCTAVPCIAAGFPGLTYAANGFENYWSSTTRIGSPDTAWGVDFIDGSVNGGLQKAVATPVHLARAVRSGR